jgi:vancomycin resistance protein VanW
MSASSTSHEKKLPGRSRAILFELKAKALRARRFLVDAMRGAPRALPVRPPIANGRLVAESRTPLYTSTAPAEAALQAGKIHNLRLAARALDGRVVRKGETFSFWANVGRATEWRGFVLGRELREGCIIPTIGGGVCQLSNALYEVALQTGAEIVERHAHSRQVPGSSAERGRDATVFWNYVDLRFRPAADVQLSVTVDGANLIVRLVSAVIGYPASPTIAPATPEPESPPVESCETCGATACFRHPTHPTPMSQPARKTRTPPTITWNDAERNGVSM